MTFQDMGLHPDILQALEQNSYTNPTPVQKAAIPLILAGKDVIALAKTGSGKTAACAIPLCSMVDTNRADIQALVVVPTRELAFQYATETQKIGKKRGVKAFAMCGGEDASMQKSKIASGVQVLVVTPGRLIDFIYSRSIDLNHVQTLILDEADEMLSMGFYEDLEFIIQCLVQKHQTCLFSATMPKEIQSIAKTHMSHPHEIVLNKDEVTPSKIDHCFVYLKHDERDQKLFELIQELNPKQGMIFCHSRIQVEKVCNFLKRKLEGVDFLHAGLSQDVRSIITSKFRNGRIRYLVATDVAARGLDFSQVTHVFIYELSDDPDIYVHRSGRTGRSDKEGVAITLVTHRELPHLKKILQKINEDPIWLGHPPSLEEENRRPLTKGRRRPFRRR